MATYYENVGNTVRVYETDPPVQQKPAKKVQKRRAVRFMYRNDHKHKLSALTVVTLTLIFAGAAGTAAASANVSVAQRQVIALNNDLRDIQSQNKAMEEEVNRYDDAISMLEAALKKLGMSKPGPYQTLHINVPEENHAEYNQQNK